MPCRGSRIRSRHLAELLESWVSVWEFPKKGDPNIVPKIVGTFLEGPPKKVPLIFGDSRMSLLGLKEGPLRFPFWVFWDLGFKVQST